MDNGDVIADKAHYIDRIVKKFRMVNSNPVTTPSLKEQQLITEKTQQDISFPCRQAVGSLLYISNSTRPDIAQAVHHAARFVGSPTEQNVQAVKRILKYLKGTNNYGIIFKKTGNTNLVGFADADYSNDPNDAHSTSGFIFKTNGPVLWKSKKQSLTATSTTEAEVIALHEAAKEAVWLSEIVTDMTGSADHRPILISEDNAACLALVNGKRMPARTRHLTRRISYIRDLIETNQIQTIQCSTTDMIADPLTKPIGPIDLRRKTRDILAPSPTTKTTLEIASGDPDHDHDDQSDEDHDDEALKQRSSGSGCAPTAHHPTHSRDGHRVKQHQVPLTPSLPRTYLRESVGKAAQPSIAQPPSAQPLSAGEPASCSK